MNWKIDEALQKQLRATLEAGVDDEAMKAVKKATDRIMDDIEGYLMYRLKDELAPNLTGWVADMAQRAIEQILEGNEDQMRRYLSCEKRGEDGKYIGWTGRHDPAPGWGNVRAVAEQHPIIHGELFEQGCIALRKKIVDAHSDLLVNERILDLEDQVKSLVEQVNKAKAEKDAMWKRLGHLETAA